MKTIRILLLALLASAAFVCPRAQAQIGQITNPVSAPLYAQDAGTCSATANSNLIQQLPPNASTTTVNLSGTFSATVTVRASNNGGATWVTLGTASAAGTTTYGTNSYTHLCADVTTYTSGTVNVTISTGVIGGGNGNSGSLSLPTTLTAPGVFTNTEMDISLGTNINTCNFNDYNSAQSMFASGSYSTAGMGSCLNFQSSTKHEGDAILGIAEGSNSTGGGGAVGVASYGICESSNCAVWGENPNGYDNGFAASAVYASEMDSFIKNSGSSGETLRMVMLASAQPANYGAIHINSSTANGLTGQYTYAIDVATGTVKGGSGCTSCAPAIILEPVNSGASALSQILRFYPSDSTSTEQRVDMVGVVNGANTEVSVFNSSHGQAGFAPDYLRLKSYTVSTLPAASNYTGNAMVLVTDATTFTPGTCTGGGSDIMIAISNGTNWSCH